MRSESGARRPVEDRLEDGGGGAAGEGRVAGGHLVEHHPEGEEVGAGVHLLAPRLLGRHVGHGPQRRARARRELVGGHRGAERRLADPPALEELGEAEVEDLGLPALGEEEVGGLDVPVNDALAVGGLEGVGHVDGDLHDLLDRERAAGEAALERLPLEQLHRDEGAPLVLVRVVDRADVRVVEGRGRARLALEALDGLAVPGQLVRQELERHRAAQARVLGLVDDTHAAAADLLEDPVVGEGFADHVSWWKPTEHVMRRGVGRQTPARRPARSRSTGSRASRPDRLSDLSWNS